MSFGAKKRYAKARVKESEENFVVAWHRVEIFEPLPLFCKRDWTDDEEFFSL